MRTILRDAADGNARASLALEVYEHRLRASIAAMAAAMGGRDTLVFCGGVGQHAATGRARVAAGLGFLGVGIAAAANEHGEEDREIADPGSTVRTLVLEAREDLEIARQVRGLLLGSARE